jgi:hypothetical protein
MIPRPAAPLLTDELKKQPPGMPGGRLVKAASGSHFRGMQHLLLILLHVVRSLGKLLKPDGVKALVAENCLLKHQLLIARRSRRRAPNLRFSDRLLFGLGSLFIASFSTCRAGLSRGMTPVRICSGLGLSRRRTTTEMFMMFTGCRRCWTTSFEARGVAWRSALLSTSVRFRLAVYPSTTSGVQLIWRRSTR